MKDRKIYDIRKISIKNFKSIENVEIDLQEGINLLIGPNSSGKTNILEAIYFLRKSLVDDAHNKPYLPHHPNYWSPEDLLYKKNIDNTLEFEIFLYIYPSEQTYYTLSYKVAYKVSKDRSTILPISHRYIYNNGESILEITQDKVTVLIDIDKLDDFMGKLSTKKKPFGPIAKKLKEDIDKFWKEGRYYKYEVDLSEQSMPTPNIPHSQLYLAMTFTYVGKGDIIEIRPFSSEQDIILIPIIIGLKGKKEKIKIGEPYTNSFVTLWEALGRIILIKHPDIGRIREPQRLTQSDRLDIRATNLAPILMKLYKDKGKMPDRITQAIKMLFKNIEVKPYTLEDGRVTLKMYENGLELPLPNMPDGLLKLISILTALELSPSLLLIDELENSTHARMIELIIDELDNADIPVIIATHSPIIVDLLDVSKVLFVSREDKKGTRVSMINNVMKLKEKLAKEGVTFSDYVFYGVSA